MFKKLVLSAPLVVLSLVLMNQPAHAQIADASTEVNQTGLATEQQENDQIAGTDAVTKDGVNQTESEKQQENDQIASILETVRTKYKSILNLDLEYDFLPLEDLINDNGDSSLTDSFYDDCEYIDKNKKGTYRHFSNYLIKELRDAGIEAYPLYVDNIVNSGYQAVLYKAGDEFFVADITSDIVAISIGEISLKEEPYFCADKLEDFIKYEKKRHTDCIFYIDADLTDRSANLDKKTVLSKIKVLYDGTLGDI